jgi:uncharacterized membrane protein YadS
VVQLSESAVTFGLLLPGAAAVIVFVYRHFFSVPVMMLAPIVLALLFGAFVSIWSWLPGRGMRGGK